MPAQTTISAPDASGGDPLARPPRPSGCGSIDLLESAHREHSGALCGLALQSGKTWAELKSSFAQADLWPEHGHALATLWARELPADVHPLLAVPAEHQGTAHALVDAAPVPSAWSYHAGELRRVVAARDARLAVLGAQERLRNCGPEATAAEVEALRETLGRIETGPRCTFPAAVDAGEWHDADVEAPAQIIGDTLDAGAKGLIVGPSKCRKSFFALQTALSVAAGRNLLGMRIAAPHRVLLWQAEVPAAHYHRRLVHMMQSMGITPADLGARLSIIHGRGFRFGTMHGPELVRTVKQHRSGILLLDPAYRFLSGNESDPETVGAFLRMLDAVAETGCAVLTVHHTAKGHAGDRQTVDRASGSGYWARDFDCQLALTPHRDDELVVLETICRSYAPRQAVTLVFSEAGLFEVSSVAPVVRTSQNHRHGMTGPAPTINDAAHALGSGTCTRMELLQRLRERGFSRDGARAMLDTLVSEGRADSWRVPVFGGPVLYGSPEAVQAARERHEKPGLGGPK